MSEAVGMCAAHVGLVSVYRTIQKLTHPLALKAMEFWDKRPADGLEIGRDIPYRAIADLLKRIIVHEPVVEGRDLNVRLAGGAVRQRLGREIAGANLSELFPTPDFPDRRGSVMTAIHEGKPQWADCVLTGGTVDMLHTELVIMPVFAPNRVANWAMTFFCFFG
jgi:hypothetical protein